MRSFISIVALALALASSSAFAEDVTKATRTTSSLVRPSMQSELCIGASDFPLYGVLTGATLLGAGIALTSINPTSSILERSRLSGCTNN